MKLCSKCRFYEIDGNVVRCIKNHWTTVNTNKSAIYNPMMFECFDFTSKDKSEKFDDDYFLSMVNK